MRSAFTTRPAISASLKSKAAVTFRMLAANVRLQPPLSDF
jgi:hypothetical protein